MCANLDDELDALAGEAQKEIMERVRRVEEELGVRGRSELTKEGHGRKITSDMSIVQQKLRELDEQRAEKEKEKKTETKEEGDEVYVVHLVLIYTLIVVEPFSDACML